MQLKVEKNFNMLLSASLALLGQASGPYDHQSLHGTQRKSKNNGYYEFSPNSEFISSSHSSSNNLEAANNFPIHFWNTIGNCVGQLNSVLLEILSILDKFVMTFSANIQLEAEISLAFM